MDGTEFLGLLPTREGGRPASVAIKEDPWSLITDVDVGAMPIIPDAAHSSDETRVNIQVSQVNAAAKDGHFLWRKALLFAFYGVAVRNAQPCGTWKNLANLFLKALIQTVRGSLE